MPLNRRHFLSLCACAAVTPVGAADVPVIAAAASLRFVMADLQAAFERDRGARVRVSFGSSGTLSQQIRHGAPFELFLSADEDYVRDLAQDGFVDGPGTVYARGRLALMAPTRSHLRVDADLQGLEEALAAGMITRFAIANAEHAPYGSRTKEALLQRGLWEALHPFLVIGENVGQAAQFAVSGNADGGIIAASLAVAGPIAPLGRFAVLPEEWHRPLHQRMALHPKAGDTARRFHDFLASLVAREVFTRHGFAAPEGV